MTSVIADGDPITIRHHISGTTSRGAARVAENKRSIQFIDMVDGAPRGIFLVDEEGDRWARGHGEEVERALQAAALLRKVA